MQFLATDPALNRFYHDSPLGPLLVGYQMEGIKAIKARGKKKTPTESAPSIPGPAATYSTGHREPDNGVMSQHISKQDYNSK